MPSPDAPLPLAFSSLAITADGARVILTTGPTAVTLAPGETAFVVGPSGAGKSRLLRALASLDPVAEGSLLLGGRPPSAWGAPAWRARVAYVGQSRPRLAGSPADLYAAARAFKAQAARPAGPPLATVADALLLDRPLLTAPFDTLSGGQAARAHLAVALALGPAVLLLDEPTAALDAATAAAAEAAIAAAAARGAVVVWVSHDPGQPGRVGGRVLRVVGGGEGRPAMLVGE